MPRLREDEDRECPWTHDPSRHAQATQALRWERREGGRIPYADRQHTAIHQTKLRGHVNMNKRGWITVVAVKPNEAWPCEWCGAEDVIAYIDTGSDETHGYCPAHLGPAVIAELKD
jgi:hypothetical protein